MSNHMNVHGPTWMESGDRKIIARRDYWGFPRLRIETARRFFDPDFLSKISAPTDAKPMTETIAPNQNRTLIRALFALIALVAVIAVLVAVSAFNAASDRGKARADDRIACAHANIVSATTRRC